MNTEEKKQWGLTYETPCLEELAICASIVQGGNSPGFDKENEEITTTPGDADIE